MEKSSIHLFLSLDTILSRSFLSVSSLDIVSYMTGYFHYSNTMSLHLRGIIVVRKYSRIFHEINVCEVKFHLFEWNLN